MNKNDSAATGEIKELAGRTSGEYEEKTKTLQLNVAHGVPPPVSEKLKFTKLVFPFSKTQIQVDLNQQFEDAGTPADELSYSIKIDMMEGENDNA